MGLEVWGRGGAEEEEKEEEEEEKIPYRCESIGHRPLWGCCPKREKERKRNSHKSVRWSAVPVAPM